MTSRRSARSHVLLCALLLASLLSGSPAAAQPSTSSEPQSRQVARMHFDHAITLRDQERWAEALAEFQESRKQFTTLHGTTNAAACLVNLERYVEALEMYESALRDFAGKLKDDDKRDVLQVIKLLYNSVGTLEIVGSEPGATVQLDYLARGELPLPAPLRVSRGAHTVRVLKEGYDPFEQRLDVAGGTTAQVTARLHRIQETGTLEIAEATGRALEVVVDDATVGKTPLRKELPPGDYQVRLRGEGELGTIPVGVRIRAHERESRRLTAQLLDASLRIEPVPADAEVSVDGLSVGRGPWEGKVPSGKLLIEVAADGFVSYRRRVAVQRGKNDALRIALERDAESIYGRKARGPRHPPHFLVEVGAAAPLLISLGGDASAGCAAACSKPLGYGPGLVARGGYDIADLSFGLSAGYLSLKQVVHDRRANVEVVGSAPHLLRVDDAVALRGVLLGAWVGYSLGETFLLHLRLGAGGLFGAVTDSRTSAPLSKDGAPWLGPFNQSSAARFFYVAPEVRAGLRLAKRIELTLGLEMPVLIAAPGPVWRQQVFADTMSGSNRAAYAWFPDAPLTAPVLALLMPALGVRYDFY